MKGVRLAKNMVAREKRQEIVSARSFKRAKRPLNFFFLIFLSWFDFQVKSSLGQTKKTLCILVVRSRY